MIKACGHHRTGEPGLPMGPQGRAQKVHVGGIGQQAMLQLRADPARGCHAKPQVVLVIRGFGGKEIAGGHLADIDGARSQEFIVVTCRDLVHHSRAQRVAIRQPLRSVHHRHRVLMRPAVFIHMKRGGHVQDLFAMLDCNHTAGREAAPIAGAVHLIDHGDRGVARADEIGVQAMAEPVLDGLIGGGQRLPDHLTAKDTRRRLASLPRAAKQVHLQRLDRQEVQQGLVCVTHVCAPLHRQ
mmetsp:Transcript_22697/g.37370  ORF Transcript_22697/g.37370 Transcript_22697/m.37370 type:complete len:240 (-) Transcript_22697:8284-9003(-)